jgi:hypothetical protein
MFSYALIFITIFFNLYRMLPALRYLMFTRRAEQCSSTNLVSGKNLIMILIQPDTTDRGKVPEIHAVITKKFPVWWNHIENVYMVRTDLLPMEVHGWLDVNWPTSYTSSDKRPGTYTRLLVMQVDTTSSVSGALQSWTWLTSYYREVPKEIEHFTHH